MLLKKTLRTIKQYKGQFISMIIMIAIGMGVFVGFNTEWYSIERNTDKFFDSSYFADYRVLDEKGFSEKDVAAVEKIDGVTRAARFLSADVEVDGKKDHTISLTVTEDSKVSSFIVTKGEPYDETSVDGVWISDRYAERNSISCGDDITFKYRGVSISGKIKGLIKSGEYLICVRDETQLMPDLTTYAFAYISPAAYKKTIFGVLDFYPQINVISDLKKSDIASKINEAVGKTCLVLGKDETISYAQAMDEVDEGKTMGTIIPILFLLIAVLTMVTTMHRLTAKEKVQIGTLKALGFKDRKILIHYSSFAALIGVVGTAIGIGLGYLIGWYIMNPNGAMGTYLDMPEWKLYMPLVCVILLVAVPLILTFIGFLSTRKMLSGTAADALRPYVPKKVKPLLIEKSKIFHKLSFGARWNLRDTMRHKARTAMSLIGIIGCMMIIVCVMGINDTLNGFVSLYYDGAMNYKSRIFVSADATEEQVDELLDKYGENWSASVSVDLNDKAVALDVYGIKDDVVRFIGENSGYVRLSDDGAYICMRIAQNNRLKAGDTFTVSPYGSSEKYTLKVAGIVRSITENVVITPEYADEIGLKYNINSIYANVEKSEVEKTESVSSVQAKEEIIGTFDAFMEILYLMIVVFILGAVILGIVVLYNLGVMSYVERYRGMATLKVLGFKDKSISKLLIGQNIWTTLVGVILGFPLGILALRYLIVMLASEYEMELVIGVLTYVVSIVLTFGVSLIVSLFVSKKNKRIDMVEALKGVE